MSSIVVVTDKCYLTCQTIIHVKVEELQLIDDYRALTKRLKIPDNTKAYQITIEFEPTNPTPRGSNTETLRISVAGKKNADALFKEIICQIREQTPDKLYLDKLVDKFFAENK